MDPLHYLRLFSASGVDAGDFLHGQLSADVVSLKTGEATMAAYCTPRGQVIAPFLVQRRESDWLLALDSSLATQTIQRMSRFILRAKVKFAALETSGVAGTTGDGEHVGNSQVLWLEALGLGYAITSQPAREATADTLSWKQTELRRGLCWLQHETSERFLPQMLGLEDIGALSFSKGCYPGQEIIARSRYLGRVKRRPVLVELEGNALMPAGAACALSGPHGEAEGTLLDSVCVDGKITTAIVIAASGEESPQNSAANPEDYPALEVDALAVGDRSWPARRIARATRELSRS